MIALGIQQKNIAVCIILSIVTCGIYTLYWFVVLSDELGALSDDQGTSGGMALLFTIITCGIYGWYWAYKLGERVDTIKMNRGEPSGSTGVVYIVLALFGLSIVYYALAQDAINKAVA